MVSCVDRCIVSFIRVWLDKYVTDFHESNLLNDLESFLEKNEELTSQLPELSELHRLVLSHYKKTPTSPRGVLLPIVEPGMCCHPRCNGTAKEYNWFSESAQQVAQGLTALDAVCGGCLLLCFSSLYSHSSYCFMYTCFSLSINYFLLSKLLLPFQYAPLSFYNFLFLSI